MSNQVDQDDFSDIESVRVNSEDVFGENKMQAELETEAKAEVNELRTAESLATRAWNSALRLVGIGRKDAPKEEPQATGGGALQTNKHAI